MPVLRLIEAYGPIELGPQAWVFSAMGTLLDFHARRKLQAPHCAKLMIHFVLPTHIRADEPAVNGIANWFEPFEADLLPSQEPKSALLESAALRSAFVQGVRNAFARNEVAGPIEEILQLIQYSPSWRDGVVKKLGKHWALKWRMTQGIAYFAEHAESGQVIPLFETGVRVIDHKNFFASIELEGNGVTIQRTKSDASWRIDFDALSCDYCSPKALAGDAHAQYALARMYLDGYLVPQSRGRALEWLQRSAAQGFKHAQGLLKRLPEQT